jgi:hypothetical protein
MDNNPISQTLFRFVSLRNPELTNEEGKDQRFIFLDKTLSGISFKDAVNNRPANVTKWAAMKTAAQNFTALTTDKEVKALNPDLYDFAMWLTRNKSTLTDAELIDKTASLSLLSTTAFATAWDNLFYQVVTQKTFYVKEAIMQILLANHVLSNRNVLRTATGAVDNQVLVNATIVLPQSMFVEDVVATSSPAGNQMVVPAVAAPANAFMQKQQAISLAQKNIEQLGNLKTELTKAEKVYRKEYAAAAKAYNTQYDALVKPILDQYNIDLAAAIAQKNAADDKDSTSVNASFPLIALPILPLYEFNFNEELESSVLQTRLSTAALKTYCKVLGITLTIADSTTTLNMQTAKVEVASFGEVQNLVDAAIKEANKTIAVNTDSGTKVISVGGVLIPNEATPYKTAWDYQLCPKLVSDSLANFDISFDVVDASWQVASMAYTLHYTNGSSATNSYYNASKYGNTILLANLFNQGLPIVNAQSLNKLEGTITFTNGQTKSFLVNGINFFQCFIGTLTALGNQSGGEGSDNTVDASFIPKGFGFKQIGIADYKKVEQTVHSYVEGEVAHIENVMAREYKEKATRRLRKSENTTTTSSETEREHQTDTSSTDRFEMQNEVSKVLQESKDFSANASFGFTGKLFNASAGANYATHSSKDESTRQAVTQAKEITAKALDRVVNKVKQERIEKMIEEFEETNKHGLDNREGDKHVSGVYRWVDKIYKNRIFNYGKRLMFEFMIPQPARLHILGMKDDAMVTTLVKPQDPRTASTYALTDFTEVNEITAKYWAGKLNAEINAMPEQTITIGESFDFYAKEGANGVSKSGSITIPENYYTSRASVNFNGMLALSGWDSRVLVSVGNKSFVARPNRVEESQTEYINKFTNKIPVTFAVTSYHTANAAIAVECRLTTEALQKWQQETFQEIITAYQAQLIRYNEQLSMEQDKADKIKGDNPNFYRQIENTILRKNCISYLVDQTAGSKKTYGQLMHNNATTFTGHEVTINSSLDNYTAFAKFLEQAFEWDIMSYNLYPFYWANKQEWLKLYQADNADGLFRSFMQSGLARVVVTVRPGFEAAVQHYMSTGQLWNGGEIPVIGDPLYLSLVDEIKAPTGQAEGKAWVTRVPTALTIIQADSIGLKVEKALPGITNDLADFEDPTQVPSSANLEISTAKMEAPSTPSANG